MGDPPTGHSIDRRNPNGNYNKRNCRWATAAQQGRTKRNNRWITYQGKKKILADWARFFGVPDAKLFRQLARKGTLRAVVKEYYKAPFGEVVSIREN